MEPAPCTEAGMRTRTSAHLPGFGGAGCAGVLARNGACTLHRSRDADGDVRAPPKVRRCGVRGRPRPQWNLHLAPKPGCGRARPRTSQGSAVRGARASSPATEPAPCTEAGMRTGTSAHLPGFGGAGCAGVLARNGNLHLAPKPGCGRGRPRTSQGSAVPGARASSPAMEPVPCTEAGMRTGTSAHLPGFGGAGCAGVLARNGTCTLHRSRDADGGRPRTSQGSAVRGARASSPAMEPAPCTEAGMRTGTSAHLPGFGGAGCAGVLARNGTCTLHRSRDADGASAHLPGFGGAGCAGVLARNGTCTLHPDADGDVHVPSR